MLKHYFNYKYTQKIYYLLISLEVLNLYITEDYCQYFKKNKKIYSTGFHSLSTINIFYKYQEKYSYIQMIIMIYNLYKIINQKNFSELIQHILKTEKLLHQYIKKFYHLHSNDYTQYQSYTANKQLKIDDIALINLYIIYLINQKINIFYLTYYLLT
uniref:Transmembrane protein n=1 Tax=Ceramothamnion japonicum TaxID=218448 RepID=A0A1C9CDH8_CERJP|nr:hypothetical protein Ceram_141 [Ceramium japonicum]AOM66417.1 hypothetical protein Ceram_141 [Ceramium japonicum]